MYVLGVKVNGSFKKVGRDVFNVEVEFDGFRQFLLSRLGDSVSRAEGQRSDNTQGDSVSRAEGQRYDNTQGDSVSRAEGQNIRIFMQT